MSRYKLEVDEEAKKAAVIVSGVIIAVLAAFFYVRKRKAGQDEKPSKRAPQLDIENPGTQDNFPASPSTSQIG